MAKLTDRQKKQIIAESVEGSSLRALGAKYGVSPTTIRRVLLHNPEFKQKVTQKKAGEHRQRVGVYGKPEAGRLQGD